MSLQKPRPRETFSAILALAALIVSAHVHRVGGHAHIELVAMRTSSGFFICWTSVRLSMASQVAGCAVSERKVLFSYLVL